jgi:hypothetical protein
MNAASRGKSKKFKPPWWASGDMIRRMTGVFEFMHLGHYYELPVMPETEPFLKVLRGERDVWPKRMQEFRRSQLAAKGMHDILDALRIQTEQTVGADVARDLGQQIQAALQPLLVDKVEKQMEALKALPAPKKHG